MKKIKKLGDLMDQSRKLMAIIPKVYSTDPVKCLDYSEKFANNFEAIKKINQDDDNFEAGEISNEFIESLEKFIHLTDKHRQDEQSPFHNVLNRDQILQILADLEKRYETLTE